MTMLKRSRGLDGEIEALAMANCLMLLSRVGETTSSVGNCSFTCKTCDKKFSSFQALGGHRASHKKPRLVTGDLNIQSLNPLKPIKKSHECPICGLEFSIGQALGGHMRKHRTSAVGPTDHVSSNRKNTTRQLMEIVTPVLKRSGSCSKRVLSLDLNLTPFENSDVELGKSSNFTSWLIA